MPITVELIRDNHVVLQTYCDPLDATQMNELKNKMQREILPAAAGKVHIIADFRQVQNIPSTILSSGARMLGTAHPNTGTMVLLTQSAFIGSMGRVFSRLAPRHSIKMVQSLDEAMEIVDALLSQDI